MPLLPRSKRRILHAEPCGELSRRHPAALKFIQAPSRNSRGVHTRPTPSTSSNFSVFDSIDCVMYGLRNLRPPNSDGATHDAYDKRERSKKHHPRRLAQSPACEVKDEASGVSSIAKRAMEITPPPARKSVPSPRTSARCYAWRLHCTVNALLCAVAGAATVASTQRKDFP